MSNIRAKYNSTPPTVADEQWADLQVDATGNLKVATDSSTVIGAVDDAAESDETQDATVIALLKGILEVLNAQTALLTDIETNTNP